MLPNFLYIGAAKSGSTWISEILRAHPRCYVPAVKDIYYFDRHYQRGLGWYASYFAAAQAGHIAIGEFSHNYILSALAADRIQRDLPDIKLLASVRNPVQRAFSGYLMWLRDGSHSGTFQEALHERPVILDMGLYFKHLSDYYARFASDQIKVLVHDDLSANPAAYAREIFDFLGLPFVASIDYQRKVLPASRARNVRFARLVKAVAWQLREYGVLRPIGVAKRSPLMNLLYQPLEGAGRPRIPEQAAKWLRDYYRDDVARLSTLLGRDLSHWVA
jgi:hypothetical protein